MQYPPDPEYEEAAVVLAVGLSVVFLWAIFRYFYMGRSAIADFFKKVVPLSNQEKLFLTTFILPYNNFSPVQKERFLKRLQWLKSKKSFVFYGDVVNPEEIKLSVCAAICLLTFGFNRFQLSRSVARIVVYPTKYYSKIKRRHHFGEYNPKLKTLVFSEDTLKEGFKIPNDNNNLALHEIAHALCFETKGSNTWQSKKFQVGLRTLSKMLQNADVRQNLMKDNYFREYGFSDIFEFFAVLTESYIETPNELNIRYPELYKIVRVMYNVDFQDPSWKLDLEN